MSQVTYPGVYIQEFVPAAPIVGVGTSTAAFVGPTLLGDVLVPTKVMSWDSFRAGFGEDPLDGTLLWYAVRGYFQNGGQVCYIVRASNAQADRGTFKDRAADVPGAPAGTTDADTLVVRAR